MAWTSTGSRLAEAPIPGITKPMRTRTSKALPASLTDQIARHRVDTFGESLAWALETLRRRDE